MNGTVNYDLHVQSIRNIMSLDPAYRGRGASVDALLEGEVPRLLSKVEQKLTAELRASGVAADVAAHSAMFLVSQCVEHFLADRVAAPAA